MWGTYRVKRLKNGKGKGLWKKFVKKGNNGEFIFQLNCLSHLNIPLLTFILQGMNSMKFAH